MSDPHKPFEKIVDSLQSSFRSFGGFIGYLPWFFQNLGIFRFSILFSGKRFNIFSSSALIVPSTEAIFAMDAKCLYFGNAPHFQIICKWPNLVLCCKCKTCNWQCEQRDATVNVFFLCFWHHFTLNFLNYKWAKQAFSIFKVLLKRNKWINHYWSLTTKEFTAKKLMFILMLGVLLINASLPTATQIIAVGGTSNTLRTPIMCRL